MIFEKKIEQRPKGCSPGLNVLKIQSSQKVKRKSSSSQISTKSDYWCQIYGQNKKLHIYRLVSTLCKGIEQLALSSRCTNIGVIVQIYKRTTEWVNYCCRYILQGSGHLLKIIAAKETGKNYVNPNSHAKEMAKISHFQMFRGPKRSHILGPQRRPLKISDYLH